jgi:hypothetical protein
MQYFYKDNNLFKIVNHNNPSEDTKYKLGVVVYPSEPLE